MCQVSDIIHMTKRNIPLKGKQKQQNEGPLLTLIKRTKLLGFFFGEGYTNHCYRYLYPKHQLPNCYGKLISNLKRPLQTPHLFNFFLSSFPLNAYFQKTTVQHPWNCNGRQLHTTNISRIKCCCLSIQTIQKVAFTHKQGISLSTGTRKDTHTHTLPAIYICSHYNTCRFRCSITDIYVHSCDFQIFHWDTMHMVFNSTNRNYYLF